MNDSPVPPAQQYQTGEQKLQAMLTLYWQARALKGEYFRQRFPDKSPDEIEQLVKEWMMYAVT